MNELMRSRRQNFLKRTLKQVHKTCRARQFSSIAMLLLLLLLHVLSVFSVESCKFCHALKHDNSVNFVKSCLIACMCYLRFTPIFTHSQARPNGIWIGIAAKCVKIFTWEQFRATICHFARNLLSQSNGRLNPRQQVIWMLWARKSKLWNELSKTCKKKSKKLSLIGKPPLTLRLVLIMLEI
jgi:hypothetical protein